MEKPSLVLGVARLLATDFRRALGSAGGVFLPRLAAGASLTPLPLSSSISSSPTAETPGGQQPARAYMSEQTRVRLPGPLMWGRGTLTAFLPLCASPGQPRRARVPGPARLSQLPACASAPSCFLGSRPMLPLLSIHPCSVLVVLNTLGGH